ncbi:MAG: helix-turn-helix domain-containing protein [Bacteroidales bacterium]|jgi:AraC-like DNA-binding protein
MQVIANSSSEQYLEQFIILMEHQRLYLIRELSSGEIARLINIRSSRLNKLLYESLGMEIRQIISMYRIQHARELLAMGVRYRELWKLSGFSSQSSMDREFEDIVY